MLERRRGEGRDKQPCVTVAVTVLRSACQRLSVAAIAWTSRAAEQGLLGIPFASGRNRSKHARRDGGVGEDQRQPQHGACHRPGAARRPASQPGAGGTPCLAPIRAASGSPPAAAGQRWPPSPRPGRRRWCRRQARPRPSSATMARGTGSARPRRAGPSPSPRRRPGEPQRGPVGAPVATPHKPKPSPRTKLTLTMTAWGSRAKMARVEAGAPSSTWNPAASTDRPAEPPDRGCGLASAAVVPSGQGPGDQPGTGARRHRPPPPASASPTAAGRSWSRAR